MNIRFNWVSLCIGFVTLVASCNFPGKDKIDFNTHTNPFKGRDHHGNAFTMWMTGAGVKTGMTYGETDEIGYDGINGRIHIHDLQATLLHQLGLDHQKLTYHFQGRDFRLTDVHGNVSP